MQRLTDEQIEELERLNQKAPPRPWMLPGTTEAFLGGTHVDLLLALPKEAYEEWRSGLPYSMQTFYISTLVVSAVNALPALLAEVTAARRVIAAVNQVVDADNPVAKFAARAELAEAMVAYGAAAGGVTCRAFEETP